MLAMVTLLIFAASGHKDAPYSCGQKETRKKEYGTVVLRVSCEYLEMGGLASALEYKGKVQHGISIHYDSLWRKRDSCVFVNGKKDGSILFWDTLGNLIGQRSFRHGIPVGKDENYWAPGHPSIIKNYNANGKEDGPWNEWWKNGNKKAEFVAKNGEIVSGTEYYPNGKPRIQYVTKYEPKNKNVLKTKYIQAEAWTLNGKSAGKIVNGNGEWIVFPDGDDSTNNSVFRAVYKDSIMVKSDELDSAEIKNWLKP